LFERAQWTCCAGLRLCTFVAIEVQHHGIAAALQVGVQAQPAATLCTAQETMGETLHTPATTMHPDAE
jgi:hypothetical protein